MIDLENQDLSTAIQLLVQEVNRGCWLVDRGDATGAGAIAIGLPTEIKVQARIAISPGRVIVESIATSVQGAQTNTSTENGTQDQEGTADSTQSGGNTNTTVNTYGEGT